jgi:hemin uptake protein HemP
MSQPQPADAPFALSPSRCDAPQVEPIPCHDAVDLTKGGPVAHIRLNGQHYALRITRQGRLILTK